jgi:hypothetical protein
MSNGSGWKIRMEGDEAAKKAIAAMPGELRAGAYQVATISAVRFRGRVVRNIERTFGFSKSRIPRPKTNRLSRGVRTYVENVPSGVRVIGGVLAIVPYARIQELGGQTRPHFIVASRKKSLRWIASEFIGPIRLTARGKPTRGGNQGAFRFARFVLHPGSTIISKPYMMPAAIEERDAFVVDLVKKYGEILQRK